MADHREKDIVTDERSEAQGDLDYVKASTAHEAAERGQAATDK